MPHRNVTTRDVELAGCKLIDTIVLTGHGGLAKEAPMRVLRSALPDMAPCVGDLDEDTRKLAIGVLQRAAKQWMDIGTKYVRKDYGQMMRVTRRELPGNAVPGLHALMTLLEVDGHDMTEARREMEWMERKLHEAYGW